MRLITALLFVGLVAGLLVTTEGQTQEASADGATAALDAFHAALDLGDRAAVERLLTPDVTIFEAGGAERSFADYAAGHLDADIAFSRAVPGRVIDRAVRGGGERVLILSTLERRGEWRGKPIASRTRETAVLERRGADWRIVHLHWSSRDIAADH